MEPLLQLLSTGGDIGVWALVWFMHRLDRRVYALELRNPDK